MTNLKLPLFFCVTLILLNTLDVITTLHGLNIGLTESNPLFPQQNMTAKLTVPFIYGLLFLITYVFCKKSDFSLGLTVLKYNLLGLNLFYSIIVINNVTLILLRV